MLDFGTETVGYTGADIFSAVKIVSRLGYRPPVVSTISLMCVASTFLFLISSEKNIILFNLYNMILNPNFI
jgi:hypothetical protein